MTHFCGVRYLEPCFFGVEAGATVILCKGGVGKHLTMHPFEFVHQLFTKKNKYHHKCTYYMVVVLQNFSTLFGLFMMPLKMFGSKFV